MTVTFPHLGPLCIAASQLLSYLDIPYVVPPANGRKALSEGTAISPEEICLPFKYMAGNLKEAHDMGADTAIMIATNGPCRLGEYGELLKLMLENVGCGYRWILIGSGTNIGIKEIIPTIKDLSSKEKLSTAKILKGFISAVKLIGRNDRFRKKLQIQAAYLQDPLEAVRLWRKTEEELAEAGTFEECFSILKQARRKLETFGRNKEADPVKVLVCGEIYTSIEEEANGNLEEKLMAMGCSVKRHIDISWWIRYSLFNSVFAENLRRLMMPRGYMRHNVGGYGRETVGMILSERWSDGVIKIMPAGCMPEIVTKAFCQAVEEEKDKSILHLIYDEMSGQAGYETRIEAFVDMLERRKHVLAGNRHRLHKHGPGTDG